MVNKLADRQNRLILFDFRALFFLRAFVKSIFQSGDDKSSCGAKHDRLGLSDTGEFVSIDKACFVDAKDSSYHVTADLKQSSRMRNDLIKEQNKNNNTSHVPIEKNR